MPPAPTSPTDALRAAIRQNRTRAVLVPGLAPLLDKLDAHLAESETRFQYLERAVHLQAGALTSLESIAKQLTGMGGAVDQFKATMDCR